MGRLIIVLPAFPLCQYPSGKTKGEGWGSWAKPEHNLEDPDTCQRGQFHMVYDLINQEFIFGLLPQNVKNNSLNSPI